MLLFGSLYPDVMPRRIDPANSLTIDNASSTPYTLEGHDVGRGGLTPLVLIYQGWTYWVFRQRISTDHIPASIGLPLTRK